MAVPIRLAGDDCVVRLRTFVDGEVGEGLQPREVGGRNRPGADLGCRGGLIWNEPTGPALEHPEAGVRRDAVEPGSERRAAVVGLLAAAPGAEEGILNCVLGRSSPRRSAVGRARLRSLQYEIPSGPETHRCATSLSATLSSRASGQARACCRVQASGRARAARRPRGAGCGERGRRQSRRRAGRRSG
jgi:hypothetical protein